jgi:hypothetical protein
VAVGVAIHAGKRVYKTHSKPFSIEAPPLALDLGRAWHLRFLSALRFTFVAATMFTSD